MTKLNFIFITWIVAAQATYIDTITDVRTNRMVQYLSLQESGGAVITVYDSSGSGLNTTAYNCTARQNGLVDGHYSMQFNGSSSAIAAYTAGLASAFPTNEGSLIIWCRSTATPWGGSGTGGTKVICKYAYDANNFIQINGTNTQMQIIRVAGGVYTAAGVTISDAVKYRDWHCLGLTWSSTANETKFYYNGAQVDSTFWCDTWPGTITAALSGIGASASNYYFNGYISDLAIWDTVLTANDMRRVSYVHTTNGVACFGNSITAGTGASAGDSNYVRRLCSYLKTPIIRNAGVSGTVLQNTAASVFGDVPQTNNGRDRYQRDVLKYNPNYVFILYGLNDLRLSDTAVNVRNYANDLGEILSGLISGGVAGDSIYVGSPPAISNYATSTPWDGGSIAKHLIYNAAAESVAVANSCVFVNVYDAILSGDTANLMSSDGIHPNDTGHKSIATAFYNAVAGPIAIDSIGIAQFTLYHTGIVDSVYVDGVLATSSEAGTDSVLITPATPMMWRREAYTIALWSGGESFGFEYYIKKSLGATTTFMTSIQTGLGF